MISSIFWQALDRLLERYPDAQTRFIRIGHRGVDRSSQRNLQERAKRGDRAKYEAVLAKVPDVEPELFDQLPPV